MDFSFIENILTPHRTFFEILSLPPKQTPPTTIRRAYLTAALKTHPDKVDHPAATNAFKILSEAFEELYDDVKQREYLRSISNTTTPTSTSPTTKSSKDTSNKKKRKRPSEKPTTNEWTSKSWAEVEQELLRRKMQEESFKADMSSYHAQKTVKRMLVRLQNICRSLDESAGCPGIESFVNGLWGGLIEGEVLKLFGVGDGWVVRRESVHSEQSDGTQSNKCWDREEINNGRLFFRHLESGEEQYKHPNPKAEDILERARESVAKNHSEPGDDLALIKEILDYLHDDHECYDYDEEVEEMEQDLEAASEAESRQEK